MSPTEAQAAGTGASPAPSTETITGAVLASADVDTLGLVANDLRLSHAEVAARYLGSRQAALKIPNSMG